MYGPTKTAAIYIHLNVSTGHFFAPTVITNVSLDADVFNNEPFGPVAAIRGFDTLDEAITEAKASLAGPDRDELLYTAEETLFGEGGFPVCPVYYYTNIYCMNGMTNVGYTGMGYFFFWYAQKA
jgi:hypothetical protein